MRLRTGIIGNGGWARDTHAPVLAAHPDVEFAGVWGRNHAATESLVSGYGVPGFPELDALLDAVDALVLTVPPTVQPELAVRAARAGKHLLLEKPVALHLAEARRIRAEAAAHDVAGLVFLTSRHRPEQRAWIAAARETGGWHSAHASWLAALYDPGAPRDRADWRQDRGALWDVGPHALSVAIGVLGPVREVTAGRGVGDTVHLVLRHGSRPDGSAGPSSTVTLSLTAPMRQSLFTAVGTAGALQMPTPLSTTRAAAAAALTDLAAMASTGRRTHEADLRFGEEIVEVLTAAESALDLGAAVACGEVRAGTGDARAHLAGPVDSRTTS